MAPLRVAYSLFSVGGLGLLLGIGLAVASRLFVVKKDKRTATVEDALPGLNCGACGFAGCAAYAEAITAGAAADLSLCTPGAEATARELARIMDVAIDITATRKVAQVHCRGGEAACGFEFRYAGIGNCTAVSALYGGNRACKFGCLGFGSCISVCPVDAISRVDKGLVWVDATKCTGCGNCTKVCPTAVMRLIPHSADFLVACRSHDKGAAVKKRCTVGCIGCKICEKKSPDGGFKVVDFLAEIDYESRGERVEAAGKCPSHCIVSNQARPST